MTSGGASRVKPDAHRQRGGGRRGADRGEDGGPAARAAHPGRWPLLRPAPSPCSQGGDGGDGGDIPYSLLFYSSSSLARRVGNMSTLSTMSTVIPASPRTTTS